MELDDEDSLETVLNVNGFMAATDYIHADNVYYADLDDASDISDDHPLPFQSSLRFHLYLLTLLHTSISSMHSLQEDLIKNQFMHLQIAVQMLAY